MRKIKISTNQFVIIFLFILILFLSLRKIMDIDIGFHLRGGEWMLENRSFHRKDVFTYTVEGNEYIAMYWLYQILIFLIYKFFGYNGISLFNSILIIFLFFLILLRIRKFNVNFEICSIVLFLAIFSMEIRFSVRPEIFTWLFMIFMFYILDEYFYKKKNYLFLLPLIQVLWVNFHGLFILGWITMFFYFLSFWIHYKKFDLEFLRYIVFSLILSFLNPYTWKGILFPFYLFTRLQSASVFKSVISELTSPFSKKALFLMPRAPLIFFYIFVFTSFLLLFLTFKKRMIHEFLIIFSFFYVAYTAVRNIPLFIIPASFILAISIKDFYIDFKGYFKIKGFKIFKNLYHLSLIFFVILTILRIFTNAYYVDRGGGNFGLGVDHSIHPVEAGDFVVKNNLKGRILNDLNHGSWFIWKVRQKVFVDGRLEVMKEEFFEKYHRSYSPGGLKKLIMEYNPDMVVFDHSYPEALFWDMDIKSMPGWRIIYWDSKSVIFAKNDFAPDIERINFMKRIKEMGIDTVYKEDDVWRILKTPSRSKFIEWLEGFFKRKKSFLPLLKMAFYAYLSFEFRCAEILYLTALKEGCTLYENIYFNLGAVYLFKGDYEKAIYCYERVLKESPDNIKAKEILRKIRFIK